MSTGKNTLGGNVKAVLISFVIILIAISVGGQLILSWFSALSDFITGLNSSLMNGSVNTTQTSVSFSLFLAGFFGIIIKLCLIAVTIALGVLAIKGIKSWMVQKNAP